MGRARGAGLRRAAVVTAAVTAGGLVAPLAFAEEPPAQARCEHPPEQGAGAAGAEVAASHVVSPTDGAQLCVEVRAPGEWEQAAEHEYPIDLPGCDYDDRRAIEVDASGDSAEVQRTASCDDFLPGFFSARMYHQEECTTSVATGDGATATDSCDDRWWYETDDDPPAWEETESDGTGTEVHVGDGSIDLTRSGYAAEGGDPYGQGSQQVTVSAEGIEYKSHSETDFGSCDDAGSVRLADPTAAVIPELDC